MHIHAWGFVAKRPQLKALLESISRTAAPITGPSKDIVYRRTKCTTETDAKPRTAT